MYRTFTCDNLKFKVTCSLPQDLYGSDTETIKNV